MACLVTRTQIWRLTASNTDSQTVANANFTKTLLADTTTVIMNADADTVAATDAVAETQPVARARVRKINKDGHHCGSPSDDASNDDDDSSDNDEWSKHVRLIQSEPVVFFKAYVFFSSTLVTLVFVALRFCGIEMKQQNLATVLLASLLVVLTYCILRYTRCLTYKIRIANLCYW